LPLRDDEPLMIALLGGGLIAGGVEQIASHPMNVGLRDLLFGGFDDLRSFGEATQTLDRLSEPGVGLGNPRSASMLNSTAPVDEARARECCADHRRHARGERRRGAP
jgi:hypothetical protein